MILQRKQKHSLASFSKELSVPHSCWSETRCQEASDPTGISLWRCGGQRGHLNISQSRAGSAPSLKHGAWLIGLSLPTILSFGLFICQKKKKKATFRHLIFTTLSQQNVTKAGYFSTTNFFSPEYLTPLVIFNCRTAGKCKTKVFRRQWIASHTQSQHTHTHTLMDRCTEPQLCILERQEGTRESKGDFFVSLFGVFLESHFSSMTHLYFDFLFHNWPWLVTITVTVRMPDVYQLYNIRGLAWSICLYEQHLSLKIYKLSMCLIIWTLPRRQKHEEIQSFAQGHKGFEH